MQNTLKYDVVIVGAGNAALCSALAAKDQGAEVLIIEKAASQIKHMRILMPRSKRCTSLDFEKYMLTWISPIRHILRSAGKYGFCAICPHIKIIS